MGESNLLPDFKSTFQVSRFNRFLLLIIFCTHVNTLVGRKSPTSSLSCSVGPWMLIKTQSKMNSQGFQLKVDPKLLKFLSYFIVGVGGNTDSNAQSYLRGWVIYIYF